MRQNFAILTVFLSAISYTEGIQQKNLQQNKAVSNIGAQAAAETKVDSSAEVIRSANNNTFAQLNMNLQELEEQSRRNLVGLDAQIMDDPIDEEVEADADATDENNVPDPPVSAAGAAGAGAGNDAGGSETAAQPASTPANLNDADAKCYSSRYQDIDAMLDPKSHFATVGIQQGRLGTCAKRLSDLEAQRLLNMNPDLQRMFGRGGPGSLQQARDYWQNVGYKNNAMAATVIDKDNIPFRCASTARDSCMCPGTLWFGASTRPDNGAKIDTFEEMREWRTVSAESEDWQSCSAIEFGSDPLPDVDKQCFCEVKPPYEASRCADEGDDCLCNGHVYFGPRYLADHSTPAGFNDVMADSFTIVDANNTGSVSCTSDTFEGADPLPDFPKQCFCDDRKKFTSVSEMYNIQDYYRSESMISSTESEIQTVMSSQYEAERAEYEYSEYYGGYDDYGGYGDADLAAAGCKQCETQCNTDSDRSLQREIERRKTITRRKYTKMREYNKYRKQTAYNKRVAGDNACTAAQRARDPVEKAKQRKLCYELRSESSRMTTEIDIESQNIDDQQRTEETTINEESNKIVNEKTEKTIINEKTTEINKSKLTEETSSRITKETEERIELINKKVETEKITNTIITTETTNIEKQITNINKQIEDVENQLTKELKEEREESVDSGSEVDETSIKVDKELTSEIKNKKEELTTKNTTISNKITSLTTHVNELNTNINTVTKEIVIIKYQIENITSFITDIVSHREELRNEYKSITNVEEKTKIQNEIDELTSSIKIKKEELESLSSKREELITKETTDRTELTYTSQTLKKNENYQQHIEEQIIVTDVVIKSKETKITEESQKKEITSVQHNCFTKKLELSMKKEEFKQFKANINKKISKMKKILEDARLQMKTSMEEMANSQSNLDTLKLQYSKTGDKMQQMILMTRINLVTNEIAKYKTSVETYNATVIKTTVTVQEMVSGQATINKQEEITKLESEVNKIMIEAMFTLSRLPLIQAEYETSGSSTTMTSVSHYCGVIQGMTIKGDIGGSSTSTSTSTTSDVSTQIIEKEEYSEKLYEEYTKIKEVSIVQKEELYESIISDKKVIEETTKIITESKTKLTELRQKEKEINTKITGSTESSEIETYKHELTSITSQITTIKNIIKVQTQKVTQYTSKVNESTTKIKEIDERVESSKVDANNAREEALTYISEGIEATYVINKKHISEKTKNVLKVKETEYKETKKKYEEETTKNTKIINEMIIKKESYTNEISDISKKIESDEKRISSITKEEEKNVVNQEIINLKLEMLKYQKYLKDITGNITNQQTNVVNIHNNFTNYYRNYTTVKAESYNSEEESKEYERITSNRRRHLNHKNVHITKINSHKKKAETHRHATESTKIKVDKQKKHFKSQRYNLRCERSRHEHNSKTYTKEVTIEERKITTLREKLTITKEESERIKIQDEITSLEASIETYKNNIKTEISKMHKNEEEETTISSKITNLEETVKKLEEETTKIENEAKIVEESTFSESAKKVTEEVKKRKEIKEDIKKTSLKEKIKKLTKIVEEKEHKVEENTKKIIEETTLISSTLSNLNRYTNINQRQNNIHMYSMCQRLFIQEPTYFDLNTVCSTQMNGGMNSMNTFGGNNGMNGGRALTASSQTCQTCYSQNPSCSGGANAASVSVVAFSVDTQGEADDIVNQLFNEAMVADVNFLSSMVNRKFSLYGQVTSDPSQVRVEVVTSDSKANNVVGKITSWRQSLGKSTQGMENDAVITALPNGSQEYIQFVLRQVGGMSQSGGMSGGMSMMTNRMGGGGGMMGGGMMGGGMMGGHGGMGGGMMNRMGGGGMMGGGMMGGHGGMMGGGMMGGMGGGMSYSSGPMMMMGQNGESQEEQTEDESKPSENNKVETMSSFISEFY